MRFLIRLYPRSRRDRYEDKLLDTIRDRELTLSDVIDTVLGTLDAQLRARRKASGDEMAFSQEGGRIHLAAVLLLLAASLVVVPLLLPHLAPGLRRALGSSLSPYATGRTQSMAPWQRPTVPPRHLHSRIRKAASRIGLDGTYPIGATSALELSLVAAPYNSRPDSRRSPVRVPGTSAHVAC